MPNVPTRTSFAAALLVLAAAIAIGVTSGPTAQAQTQATTINTVVLRLTGQMTFAFDKGFLKTVKDSKSKLSVKGGATLKGRKATLPIDATTTIELSPGTADVLAKGTVVIRRAGGRKVIVQDIALRLRDSGADVSGTVRGRPQRQFAALSISPTIAIQQAPTGYSFVDVLMLVSPDMATAANKARISGIKAGAVMGLMTAQISADIPSFTLPGLGGLIPALTS